MTQRVGFVGVGIMGGAMAANVLKRGFPLTVFDLAPAAVERLVARGAARADSPAAVAAASDVVLTSLPDSPDVEAVYLGAEGLLAAASAGTVLVETSTIDPLVSRRLAALAAERGLALLDAPVSGGQAGAVDGTLTLMVGGDAEALERARPVLEAISARIVPCGPSGSGHAMKLVGNLISCSLIVLNAEALVLGAKWGLSAETMLDVVGSSFAANTPLEKGMRPRVLAGDDTPGFATRLAYKDLGLALRLGYQLGVPLPMTALAREELSAASAAGLASSDQSTVMKLKERQAGVRVRLREAGGVAPLADHPQLGSERVGGGAR